MQLADSILQDALERAWAQIRFSHRLDLDPPTMALHSGRSKLGYWQQSTRILSMSREHCLEDPWMDVAETLLHEVAHQIVDELLGGHDTPHGPRFQEVLAQLGALPGSSGEEPKVVSRVRKLLALAGSDNQAEAELAMAKAQKLMLKNLIDVAKLDGAEGMVRRQLGQVRLRQPRWRSTLLGVVGKNFFVKAMIATVFVPQRAAWGSAFEIVGRTEDVEMASYAYAFVRDTAERLWARHLAANPRASRSRDRFLLGVVLGFAARLTKTTEEARQEGLVWVGDPELDRVWDRRHPRLSNTRGTYTPDEHFRAGQAAGGNLVLHRPVGTKGGGGGLLEG